MSDDISLRARIQKFRSEGTVALGASCFWASVLLGLAGMAQTATYGSVDASASIGATAVVVVAFTFSSGFFDREPLRRFLSLATLFLLLFGTLVPMLIQGGTLIDQTVIVLSVLARVAGSGGLMLLWGLWFASMDTRQVIPIVSVSAVLAVAVFALGVGASPSVASVLIAALPVLSAFFYVSSQVTPATPEPQAKERSRHLGFYGTRALFGLMIGLVGGLNSLRQSEVSDHAITRILALSIGISLVLVLAGIVILRNRISFNTRYLPALPLLTAGLLLLPFLGTSFTLVSQVATATTYISWMILSSIQLSGLKTSFGMSAIRLSFSEKSTIMVAWFLGHFVGLGTNRLLEPGVDPGLLHNTVPVVLAYAVVFAATFSLGKYMIDSAPLLVSSATENLPKLICLACKKIADQFRLTPREEEVLVLLASGRSRPYIERSLLISSGTARTHINHIHQKLGIHTQQELLDLVGRQGEGVQIKE